MNKIKEVKGLQWDGGAIGNALWEGVRMKDLLKNDNVFKREELNYEDYIGHVHLRGYDKDNTSGK